MKQSRLSRNTVFVLILTILTIFVWIGVDVYKIVTKKEIPAVLKEQLEPLNTNLETKALEELSTKKSYTIEDLGQSLNNPTPVGTTSGNR
jgi:hypothetical protein